MWYDEVKIITSICICRKSVMLFDLYAMVFGLSEMWTKIFSTIPLAQPDWYDSYYSDPYTTYFYYRMLTRSMYEPIHQNLLDYQTEQMKSTADSMGSSFGGFSGGGAGSW